MVQRLMEAKATLLDPRKRAAYDQALAGAAAPPAPPPVTMTAPMPVTPPQPAPPATMPSAPTWQPNPPPYQPAPYQPAPYQPAPYQPAPQYQHTTGAHHFPPVPLPPAGPRPSETTVTLALILSCMGIAACGCAVFSIAGLTLGIITRNQAAAAGVDSTKSLWAIILGAVGLVLFAVVMLVQFTGT